jgi:hypothetical protein
MVVVVFIVAIVVVIIFVLFVLFIVVLLWLLICECFLQKNVGARQPPNGSPKRGRLPQGHAIPDGCSSCGRICHLSYELIICG